MSIVINEEELEHAVVDLLRKIPGNRILIDHFLDRARERAYWYSGFGVPVFVAGMMVSAFALRGLAGAGA